MEKRTFFNPVINDTATFIKTSEETKGEYSLLEIELYKSYGPPYTGDKIRITAQLVEAEEDFHFWSETWDRKLENIFEIQDHLVGKQTHKTDV